jgi:ethanolamine utilization microcompartment shell protein EutL
VAKLLSVKEEKYMATYNAIIERKDNSAVLKLALGSEELIIVLTEDNPNEVKSVFNNLLSNLKNGVIEFILEDTTEDLYFHICKEYITQLNAELKSTFAELNDNGLLNELE